MKRVNCTKCGVRIIPYNYNYIFDAVNRRAIRVCKRCHDEHIKNKCKKARTHSNEIRALVKQPI